MSLITAIIVDDEVDARENLHFLIDTYCPKVKVLGEASNVDSAIELITMHNPQVVFLDIEMPKKNGFQLLNAFKDITFKIIFITAYNHYAIKAFQVSALDYLLKPIDVELFQKAIKKVEASINNTKPDNRIPVLRDNQSELTKIAVPYKNNYAILYIKDIICIEADRMYSIIYTVFGTTYFVTKTLQHYEQILSCSSFWRVHRSWLINSKHIQFYSKKERAIELSSKKTVPVSKGFKAAFEQLLNS